MPNQSTIFLFALGILVMLLGYSSIFSSFDIPTSILAGLAAFAFLYATSEMFEKESSKSIIMFFAVLAGGGFFLPIELLQPNSKDIEDWVNGITIVSMGVTIYSLALKDLIKANREKNSNKST